MNSAVLNPIFERWFKWIILTPAVLGLLVTALIPLGWLIVNSFYLVNLLTAQRAFVGLSNYVELLSDPEVLGFILNTVLYVFFSILAGFPIAILLGKLLSLNIRYRVLWLVAILLPWMFPKVAGAIMWNWMLNQQYGVINYIMTTLGLVDKAIPFLNQTGTAFGTIVFVDIWYWTPFACLILFGGFSRVPKDLVEAARVDGANAWQTFMRIELAYILPEILAALLLRTMFSFREFGIPYLLGQGGPGRSTEIMGLTIYKYTISWLQLGAGAALSVILLIIVSAVLVFYFNVIRSDKGITQEPIYE